MICIGPPQSDEEFAAYFALRYEILRKPWGEPDGTERDKFDDDAVHAAATVDEKLAGIGRLHFIDERQGQIRYMAVKPEFQGQGVGREILRHLESIGYGYGLQEIILNARQNAVEFYQRLGYEILGEGPLLWGEIPHKRMRKLRRKEGADA